NKVPFYGAAIVCLDDAGARGLLPRLKRRVITYGFAREADVRAVDRRREDGRSVFTIAAGGEALGEVRLLVPGIHNVSNSLAAASVGLELGIPFDRIREGLEQFSGIARRLEIRSDADDVLIVDDYAHHPTEIAATLSAAREWRPGRRLVAVFQPHRYTRTRDLGGEFGPALAKADRVVVTSVYAAGEAPIAGVSSAVIADAARAAGHANVSSVDSWEDAVDLILPETRPGDVVLTLGAGDVWKAGDLLAARLAASRAVVPARSSGGAE
ncbi:MAG: UDP-N-acetylmuramate--L-alanine ligase, partial [Candidatus Eiseniibacteriota bacterium]